MEFIGICEKGTLYITNFFFFNLNRLWSLYIELPKNYGQNSASSFKPNLPKKYPPRRKLDMYACMHACVASQTWHICCVPYDSDVARRQAGISSSALPLRSGLRSVVTGLSVEKRPYNRPAWIEGKVCDVDAFLWPGANLFAGGGSRCRVAIAT